MTELLKEDRSGGLAAASASLRVAGEPSEVWDNPGMFSRPLLLRAAALFFFASVVSGTFSVLYALKVISVVEKDCLVGSFYAIAFAGALSTAGKLDGRRAAMLVGNAVLFSLWNYFFFSSRYLALFVFVLEIWLPVYWVREIPDAMRDMGFGGKGMLRNVVIGVFLALLTTVYFAWGMVNYGFKLRVDEWYLVFNAGQVLPMYIGIFGFFHIVWLRLKGAGYSQFNLLGALGVMSFALNAPAFFSVGVVTGTPPGTYVAGFVAITCVMAAVTHVTFKRYGSCVPAACVFAAMSDMLHVSGLV